MLESYCGWKYVHGKDERRARNVAAAAQGHTRMRLISTQFFRRSACKFRINAFRSYLCVMRNTAWWRSVFVCVVCTHILCEVDDLDSGNCTCVIIAARVCSCYVCCVFVIKRDTQQLGKSAAAVDMLVDVWIIYMFFLYLYYALADGVFLSETTAQNIDGHWTVWFGEL